jgi:SAM-dependent methyltransferase
MINFAPDDEPTYVIAAIDEKTLRFVAAVYTEYGKPTHIIRKVMVRMTAWTNYVWRQPGHQPPGPSPDANLNGYYIMKDIEKVQVYDSQSEAYHHAFQVFLDHTDQKVNARRWLDGLVRALPERRVFVDAGAGNGQVTAWFLGRFARTIAVEPNPSLNAELRRTCPGAEVLPVKILDARPAARGDLILCSHVLYYIDRSEWPTHVARMASWLSPDGALVVVLQNHETDCMRMLEAFHGRRFDLAALAGEFEAGHDREYRAERELVPAHVTAPDFASAYAVAEFMLNLLPMPNPPERGALEAYVRGRFAAPGGGFRFSCHQDFLVIRRR